MSYCVSCPLGSCSIKLTVPMPVPVPVPVPGQLDGRPRQQRAPPPAHPSSRCGSPCPRRRHASAAPWRTRGGPAWWPGAAGCVLGGPTARCRPAGRLRGSGGTGAAGPRPPMPSCRCEAPGRSSQGKQTFAGISESIPVPELPQETHMCCTPKGSPCSPQPLLNPWEGWGEHGSGCQHPARLGTVGLGCAHHAGTEQGVRRGSGGRHRCPRHGAGIDAAASSGKAPHLWDLEGLGGLLPSCQAAAAGSPPSARAGSAAGDVGCGGRTCSLA